MIWTLVSLALLGGGIFLPWGLCREMVELKFWQEQVKELRGEVKKQIGK